MEYSPRAMSYALHFLLMSPSGYYLYQEYIRRGECLRPGSQYLASRPEVNVNAWANARIELGSILAFAHAFTLTSGRDARYCEPGLTAL